VEITSAGAFSWQIIFCHEWSRRRTKVTVNIDVCKAMWKG
jgi:hypothetical protein